MVKRAIQLSKPGYTVGIEHDNLGIRCARLLGDGRGGFTVDRLEELKGDFTQDAALLDGFRTIKNTIGISNREPVVTCLTGKQVFAAQMEFRKLGAEEMEQALRLELRKTVHFEVATASLDYEFLGEGESTNGGMHQVLVALAATSMLNREMGLLERAGLHPGAIDVLPVAVANALWIANSESDRDAPLIALHIGPQLSTIVIDAEHFPFFNRHIYFAAEDIFRPDASQPDRERRIQSLADEVARSLSFYEKNSSGSGFREIVLLGDFLDGEGIIKRIKGVTGLPVVKMNLPKQLGSVRESIPGKFDLAVALALRGEL